VSPGDEAGYAALAARIAARGGPDVSAYKDRCLRRRIAVRMRACGAHSYGDYLAVLDREPGELDRLLDAITINVTKFFRNRETWECLGRRFLPELLRSREGRVRVWSAGCASGEEPYTAVMLLAEVLAGLGHPGWLDRVRVDATDIDRESLERAQAARYPLAAFSEAPADVQSRFTVPVAPDRFEIRPEYRALVQVRRHDLLREPPFAPVYDLILCRNVVIYFDRDNQERLMHRFTDALAPDGVLVLGKVETIFGSARERLDLAEPRERIYRRTR
jgi:chemotaxis methyl-accepting protein methylase